MPETIENLNSKGRVDACTETNHVLQQIKSKILACSIEEDQQTVADQWVKTFKYGADNPGLLMAKFVIACVAQGDFKVRSYLSEDLHAPNDVLTVIDYLSHASRIILDYQGLSNGHKNILLNFFPKPAPENKIYSRTGTHAINRKDGTISELKGISHGLRGLLPTFFQNELHFGINVAMGGEEQTNFIGKKITANGYSGHVYLYHEEDASVLMFGLEQTAPFSFEEWRKLIYRNEESKESYQQGIDQFQQAHSALGASDTFTAAGSLYFSDPVYQAKLLAEKNCFAPGKYGAMQVTITDQNWKQIISFLEGLTNSEANEDSLRKMLMLKPCSASNIGAKPNNFISIEFSIYFDRIFEVFIANNQSIDEQVKAEIQQVQQNLIEAIQKVKEGDIYSFDTIQQLIKSLSEFEGLPQEYVIALERIEQLFKKQFELDPKLIEKSYKISLACKERELLAETKKLLYNALDIQEYFIILSLGHQHQGNGDEIVEDDYIKNYLNQLTQLIADLKAIPKSPWDKIEEKIQQLETLCENANHIIQNCPKLFSQAIVEEIKKERDEQNVKNQQLEQKIANQEEEQRNILQQKELALLEAQKKIDLLEQKGVEDQRRVQEAERNFTSLQEEKDRVTRRLRIAMPILNEIVNLKDKRIELQNRNHRKAAKDLKELYKAVENGIKAYTENNETNEEIALDHFKNSLTKKISEISNKGNLKKHRNILAQLLKIVVTLGVSLLVNGVNSYRKRGSAEFFPVTNTMKKVRKLEAKTIKLTVK